MKNKHFIPLILLLFVALPSFAQQVSVEEALLSAKQFLRGTTQSGKRKANAVDKMALAYKKQKADKTSFYIFNENDADGGFVIVSGDQRTEAIIGYTENGDFNEDSMPDNMRAWLNDYAEQIAMLDESPNDVALISTKAPVKNTIEPMISTKWNQNAPYNAQTYMISGKNCPTGCVATGMAQILNFWKYPAYTMPPVAGYSYTWKNSSGATISETVPAISSHSIYWSSFKNTYTSTETADNLAWLMRHCGQMVSMEYTPSSSGAVESNCVEALKTLGYDKWARYIERSYYSIDEWEGMIYKEIAEKRPVLYGGRSATGGHAFICDGYDGNGYYHINWGWGGTSDGYFLLSLLDPKVQGTGGGQKGYSLSQHAVIGISHGHYSGTSYKDGICLKGDEPTLNGTTLTYSIWNKCGSTETFDYGMAYIKTDGSFEVIEGLNNSTFEDYRGWKAKTFTPTASMFPGNGTYKVVPVSRISGTTTLYSAWPLSKYLKVVVSSNRITSCSMGPEESLAAKYNGYKGPAIVGFPHVLKFTITNNSIDEFVGETYMLVRVPDGTMYKVSESRNGVYLRTNESVDLEKEVNLSSSYGAGTYTYYLSKSETSISQENLLAQGTIQMKAAPTTSFNAVIPAKDVTFKGGYPLTAVVTIKNGASAPYPYPILITLFKGDVNTSTASSIRDYTAYLDTPIAAGQTRSIEIPIPEFDEDGVYAAKVKIYTTSSTITEYRAGDYSEWLNFCAVPIGESGWATYAAPYVLNLGQVNDNSIAFYSATVESGNLKLTQLTSNTVAGTGLLVKGKPNAIYAVPAASGTGISTKQSLVGVTEEKSVSPNAAFVLGKNSMGKNAFIPFTGTRLDAHQAYLPASVIPSGASYILLDPNDVNAILSAEADSQQQKGKQYNLAGQQVGTNYKGIVIKNGKKILNR